MTDGRSGEQRRVDDVCADYFRRWLREHGYTEASPGLVPVGDVLAALDRLEPPTIGLRRQHSGWDRGIAAARAAVTVLAGGADAR